ncbi:MAG TPA: hypothetical protein VMH83_01270 [Candidatus Acidoferrum sp.]|nr:hypothetical protein [Candidatus Acidoferrum sp.]
MKALRATLSKYSLAELGTSTRMLLADSAHQDLLGTLTHSLVLQDGVLINTANGEYRELAQEEGLSREQAIARAAGQMIASPAGPASILLLLPPAEFLSSRYQLALKGEGQIRSAIGLQSHTLVPAYEGELLLGLNAQSPEGAALWYPARAADALFVAFQAERLFLAALMPRTLALPTDEQYAQELILQDDDNSHAAQLELRGGVLHSHLVIARQDLEQAAFAEQWQAETAKAAPAQRLLCKGREFWDARRSLVMAREAYCFFPRGAEQQGRRLLLQKKKRQASIAAGVLVGLLCLPFIANWVQVAWLQSQVDKLRDASADARRSQSAVYAMDDEWGTVAGYPHQNVPQVLLTLNQFINGSLTTFTLNKGVVDLSGYAQDPALLVEQLSEREEFHEVSQSRSSSGSDGGNRGDRFGIRLNLSGVDFKAYEAKYPVVKQ